MAGARREARAFRRRNRAPAPLARGRGGREVRPANLFWGVVVWGLPSVGWRVSVRSNSRGNYPSASAESERAVQARCICPQARGALKPPKQRRRYSTTIPGTDIHRHTHTRPVTCTPHTHQPPALRPGTAATQPLSKPKTTMALGPCVVECGLSSRLYPSLARADLAAPPLSSRHPPSLLGHHQAAAHFSYRHP